MTGTTALACPGCGQAMRALALERSPHGQVAIDLCPACRGLWFDAHESVQLTPEATIALFREVAALGPAAARSGAAPLRCPRCDLKLAPTQDLQRTTRFSYWRCPRGHGRFTPLGQFLREKDFVRPLSPAEVARLRAQIGTVRCSGCGAPVDLGRVPACSYCGAPIEALDPEAVGKAIARWEAGRAPPATPAPGAVLDAWLTAERAGARSGPGGAVDLVAGGLAALLRAFDPG